MARFENSVSDLRLSALASAARSCEKGSRPADANAHPQEMMVARGFMRCSLHEDSAVGLRVDMTQRTSSRRFLRTKHEIQVICCLLREIVELLVADPDRLVTLEPLYESSGRCGVRTAHSDQDA